MKKGNNRELQHWDTLRKSGTSSDQSLNKLWGSAERVGKDFQPDIDQGLRRLKHSIAQDRGAKVVPLSGRRRFLQAAVAAAVVFIAGWAVWSNGGEITPTEQWVTVETAEGETREVVLPDGSTITLNADSELQYASNLNELDQRLVKLSGEAFFDVTRRPEQPFIINAAFVEVSVLGTSFNVLARPDATFAEVEVSTGKVAVVQQYTAEEIILLPNEKAHLEMQEPITKAAAPHLNSRSWQTRRLKFRNTTLLNALPAIERHFGIEFAIDNQKMLSCTFTAQWEDAQLTEVLETLRSFTGGDVRKIGPKKYQISGSCQG